MKYEIIIRTEDGQEHLLGTFDDCTYTMSAGHDVHYNLDGRIERIESREEYVLDLRAWRGCKTPTDFVKERKFFEGKELTTQADILALDLLSSLPAEEKEEGE